MNRETYLETLKNHYADDIKEAYFECEHHLGSQIDIPELNQRLGALFGSAQFEGLNEHDFDELVKSILPDLHSRLDYKTKQTDRKPPKKEAA